MLTKLPINLQRPSRNPLLPKVENADSESRSYVRRAAATHFLLASSGRSYRQLVSRPMSVRQAVCRHELQKQPEPAHASRGCVGSGHLSISVHHEVLHRFGHRFGVGSDPGTHDSHVSGMARQQSPCQREFPLWHGADVSLRRNTHDNEPHKLPA